MQQLRKSSYSKKSRVYELLPLGVGLAAIYLFTSLTVRSFYVRSWFFGTGRNFSVTFAEQGWGSMKLDSSVTELPLRVAGKIYSSGIGTHGPSKINLVTSCDTFYGLCGIDDAAFSGASVVCRVRNAEGQVVWESPIQNLGDPAAPFSLSVGKGLVTLEVDSLPDGNEWDHVNWVGLGCAPLETSR